MVASYLKKHFFLLLVLLVGFLSWCGCSTFSFTDDDTIIHNCIFFIHIFNFLTLTWNYYQTSQYSKKISDIFTTRLNIIIDFLRTYYVHRHGYISSFSCLIYYRPKTQHLLLLLSWEMCINCNYTFQFSFRFLLWNTVRHSSWWYANKLTIKSDNDLH